MASVYELAEKYAAARGMSAPADHHAAAYITDVRAGHVGLGDACRARGYCTTEEHFLDVAARKPTFCDDCGAPVRRASA
jgi:hypothetical protein